MRAKRKLGQILKATPKNKGGGDTGRNQYGATGTKKEPVADSSDTLPTYKEIKLNKKLAAEAQRMASKSC